MCTGEYTLYLQLADVVVGLDVHGPPALGALLLEEVHHGHRAVRLEHVERALLDRLGAAREVVEVERDGAQEVVLGEVIRVPHLGKGHKIRECRMSERDRNPLVRI